jgi:hypothetical protein
MKDKEFPMSLEILVYSMAYGENANASKKDISTNTPVDKF